MSNHAGLFLFAFAHLSPGKPVPPVPMIVSVSDSEDNLAIFPVRPPRATGTPTQTPRR
jgi:hypothetical protein